MSKIIAVALNTFRQTVRERLFFNIFVFGVGMLLLGMLVANITFGYPDRVVRSIGLSGVSIALDLIGLLIGVSLIHQEIDRKTLFVVLTRPLRRWQYVLGRYAGLVGTLLVAGVGLALMFSLTLLMVGGTVTGGDLASFGAALVEACLIASIGIVLSAFSTPTLSAGMGLGLWIVGATTDDLVRLTEANGGAMHELAKVIWYVAPSLARFNFRDQVIHGPPIEAAHYLGALGYGVLYASFLVAIAGAILSRREMM